MAEVVRDTSRVKVSTLGEETEAVGEYFLFEFELANSFSDEERNWLRESLALTGRAFVGGGAAPEYEVELLPGQEFQIITLSVTGFSVRRFRAEGIAPHFVALQLTMRLMGADMPAAIVASVDGEPFIGAMPIPPVPPDVRLTTALLARIFAHRGTDATAA